MYIIDACFCLCSDYCSIIFLTHLFGTLHNSQRVLPCTPFNQLLIITGSVSDDDPIRYYSTDEILLVANISLIVAARFQIKGLFEQQRNPFRVVFIAGESFPADRRASSRAITSLRGETEATLKHSGITRVIGATHAYLLPNLWRFLQRCARRSFMVPMKRTFFFSLFLEEKARYF